MIKNILLLVSVFLVGFAVSYFTLKYINLNSKSAVEAGTVVEKGIENKSESKPEIVGFLPFWLIGSAREDYSSYITNLSVFSLVVDSDGGIKKYTKPTEGEPGYFSLINGKFDKVLAVAKENKMKTTLVVFSGDDTDITSMLNEPTVSAGNFVSDVIPIAQEYGFDEINLDIEQVSDASESARIKYKDFVAKVREETNKNSLELTIDVTASSFIKTTNLVDPFAIAEYVDKIIIMAYDYHFMGSFVTGAVAPQNGAGTISEYDVETAIIEATRKINPKKIVLGIPLYGYEWESVNNLPRSATIPSTGLIISNKRAEEFLKGCEICEAKFDETDREMNIIYKDGKTGFYHQIFYPELRSMESKLNLVEKYNLGGVALWALGYEGKSILQPLVEWNHQR